MQCKNLINTSVAPKYIYDNEPRVFSCKIIIGLLARINGSCIYLKSLKVFIYLLVVEFLSQEDSELRVLNLLR